MSIFSIIYILSVGTMLWREVFERRAVSPLSVLTRKASVLTIEQCSFYLAEAERCHGPRPGRSCTGNRIDTIEMPGQREVHPLNGFHTVSYMGS